MGLTYDEWQAAFEDEFFDGRYTGRSFWLFVDDEGVDSIAAARGEPGGVEDLKRLGQGYFAGEGVRSRYFTWLAGPQTTPPPVLPILALTVLAATRMHEGDGVSQTNYYRRLRVLLGLEPGGGQPNGFSDNVVPYWKRLREWAEEHEGDIGRLVIPDRPHPAFVGYPISQALWRQADTDRLSKGLWEELGEDLSARRPEEIEGLARFLVIERGGFRARARRVFQDSGLAEIRQRVLEDVLRQPPPPDTGAGRQVREQRLEVLLRGRPGTRLQPSFVVPRDPRWPAAVRAMTDSGSAILASSPATLPGYYRLEGVEVTDQVLAEGFSLASEYGRWSFTPSEIIILAAHPELSLATTRVMPGARVVVLTPADHEPLTAASRPVTDESVPSGWVRYDDVDPAESLADIAPALEAARHEPLELVGGLAVRPQTYLRSSLPELQIPAAHRTTAPFVSVVIDGQEARLPRRGDTATLPVEILHEGHHLIRLDGAAAAFRVTEGLAPTCGYAPERSIQVVGGRASGAYLDPKPSAPRPRPVVASSRADEVLLLGSSPADIEVHHLDQPPRWLQLTPLHTTDVEIRPRFSVVWIIEILPIGSKCRLVDARPPEEGGTVDPQWVEAVTSYLHECSDIATELAEQYQQLARRLDPRSRPQ